ncbi:DUF1801 domain-containing protein [Roseobacter ponti]|uniref:DUF1801 domain-containing protein n=1 Tax=Roseobacter ponti TaxID=1891787 RepID=A0A858SSB7_9RHOB|nr:DUF1801 domain-containing protein [Roseobacter ponti]QJF49806.1 DUF1801 domain-containing protein [Roseobacter ponti]
MTASRPLPPGIAPVFDGYPAPVRACHMQVRDMILTLACDLDAGPIDETLKWGQPAYLNTKRKTGTTLRLGWPRKTPERAGVYVHCQTSLVSDFRARQGTGFDFDGTRGILLETDRPLPEGPLAAFLSQALTYHRNTNTHG